MSHVPDALKPRRQPAWRFYDAVAERYPPQVDEAGSLSMPQGDRRAAEFFVEQMMGCERVLDVGCGSGFPSLIVAPRVGQVVGVDRAPAMVALARKRAKKLGLTNAHFVVSDGQRLPFPDGTFDGAEILGALESMDAPDQALGEVHRTLARDGLVACLDEDWQHRCETDPQALRMRRLWLDGGKLFYQFVERGPDREVDCVYELDPESDFVKAHVDMGALQTGGRTQTKLRPEELDPKAVRDAWYDDTPRFTEETLVRLFREAGFVDVKSKVVPLWESEILLTARRP